MAEDTQIQKSKRQSESNKKRYTKGEIFGFQKGNTLGLKNSKWLKLGRKGGWAGSERAKKISKALKGKKSPQKSISKIGRKNPMYGKYKELSGNWKGGISFEEYSINWKESLRRTIRERDKYICQLCGKPQGDFAHDVHHIDYDKKNCNPNNLITLCRVCNAKVNKNRNYWTNYFYAR